MGAACLEAGELLMARRQLEEAARHLACAAQLLPTGTAKGDGEGPREGRGGGGEAQGPPKKARKRRGADAMPRFPPRRTPEVPPPRGS